MKLKKRKMRRKQKVLERYKVNFILIERESVLAKFLKSGLAQDWRLTYEDEMATVFIRERAFVRSGEAEWRK